MMQADDRTGKAPLRDIFEYAAWGPVAGGPARQLVVLLHGIGMNGNIMAKMAQEVSAMLPHARILAPHGPEPYAPAPRQPGDLLPDMQGEAIGGRQWFSNSGTADIIRVKLMGVAQKMNQFIDNQRDMMGLTGKDIAIMGFSQGGGLALYTAFLNAQEIGAVVGHSTIFYADPEMNSRPPTLYIYGNADMQFSQTYYDNALSHLTAYNPAATITVVEGLQHRTSNESRRITAAFIRDRLTPPPPAVYS